jgi:hypothetical protein
VAEQRRATCTCRIRRPRTPPFWETWERDPACPLHGNEAIGIFDPVANARAALTIFRRQPPWDVFRGRR